MRLIIFRKPISILLYIAILTNCSSLDNNKNSESEMIYGEDNRIDVVRSKNPILRKVADSTPFMIYTTMLGEVKNKKYSDISERNFEDLGFGGKEICEDERFAKQPLIGWFNCSAFLVANDIVVTAGHCVLTQEICDSISFGFGYQMSEDGEIPDSIDESEVYACKDLIKASKPKNEDLRFEVPDFSILRLDRKVINHIPLVLRKSGEINKNQIVAAIGYPKGLPLKIAGDATIRNIKSITFDANLDTYENNSGSVVVDQLTGIVEGILVNGDKDFVVDEERNCIRSNVCEEGECKGETVVKTSAFRKYIPGLSRD